MVADSKNYYKALIIRTVRCLCEDLKTYQWKGIESPETDLNWYIFLIHDKLQCSLVMNEDAMQTVFVFTLSPRPHRPWAAQLVLRLKLYWNTINRVTLPDPQCFKTSKHVLLKYRQGEVELQMGCGCVVREHVLG